MTHQAETYEYRDASGAPSFRVIRTGHGDAKRFHAERFDGARWVSGTTAAPRVLYRLAEVLAAVAGGQRVYIVEGEKDAESLATLGLCGTTNPFGAGKWDASFAACLTGADVVIIPDRDDAGRRHAADVARSLVGVAASVRVLELDGPEKGDVTDWIAAGGTKEQLEALGESAPAWTEPAATDASPSAPARRFKLLTMEELLRLPPLAWLVDGVLPARSLAILYGAPGTGKTFAAIDLACAIASGRRWHDRETQRGRVVIVAAEGNGGALGQRLAAWRSYHGHDQAPDVRVLQGAVQLTQYADVSDLLDVIGELAPSLIIFDTLARCTIGADENSSTDMKGVTAAAGRITRETRATVLLIHHTGKRTPEMRGSSVLESDADTLIHASTSTRGDLRITCAKQKEDAGFEPIALRLHAVEGSAVLVDAGTTSERVSERERRAFAALSTGGMTHGEWQAVSGLTDSTFNRARKDLVEAGKVVERDGKYFPVDREDHFHFHPTVVELPREAPSLQHSLLSSTSTPRRGGRDGSGGALDAA